MEKTIETNVIVTKEDINKIGFTWYNLDGFLSVITSPETAGVEEILLRSILKCFGDYKVTKVDDFQWEDDPTHTDVELQTNLPYGMFDKVLTIGE